MDDAFQELESELRGLMPLAPSHRLRTAIAQELAPNRNHVRYVWWALPIAAAVALAASQWSADPAAGRLDSPPAGAAAQVPADVFRPVAAENVLLRSEEEGVLTFADGTPARQIRASYVDTITWRNPATNASLTWTLPREEIRVVPVSYQ
ncbi:hypothetical protein [Opitutus terrae]|uniref:Uncharacterized protein n=1 Tax=Opitutus terrae (strain DSM 11246 / JCM 15787 / PB90-1) TaxID=452637 RepID=B1ZUQ3_OPITP|nr:hypothetical protein [Opitutus terrae]ACB74937.1 hypothetical protein Oter_1653 [Opitutus terrae PB90-1]